jgi:murein DD-endopeptidase MepM/ murein hydrolase activator NlpD
MLHNEIQCTLANLKRFAIERSVQAIQQDVSEWLSNIGYSSSIDSGARFGDLEFWWKKDLNRKHKHEGIDIKLSAGTPVPALYQGAVVGVIPQVKTPDDFSRGYDFIGNTVIIAHSFVNEKLQLLVSIYGHIDPSSSQNEIIGYVAKSQKHALPSHLHLSMGWLKAEEKISNWKQISFQETSLVELFNPLPAS